MEIERIWEKKINQNLEKRKDLICDDGTKETLSSALVSIGFKCSKTKN